MKIKLNFFLSVITIAIFLFLAIASDEEVTDPDDCYRLEKEVYASASVEIKITDISNGNPIENSEVLISFDKVDYEPPENMDLGCYSGKYFSWEFEHQTTFLSDDSGIVKHTTSKTMWKRDVEYLYFSVIVYGPDGSNYKSKTENGRIYPYDEGLKKLFFELSE